MEQHELLPANSRKGVGSRKKRIVTCAMENNPALSEQVRTTRGRRDVVMGGGEEETQRNCSKRIT